jgi:signal peptidase I
MKAVAREILETVLLTLLIFLLVRSVVQNFRVEGESMSPTLHSGQYLLINKAVYWLSDTNTLSSYVPDPVKASPLFHPPQRGDVIVFRFPREPSRDFIKRVIAVPGEMVEIRDHRVYVDDAPLNEPYIKDPPLYPMAQIRVTDGNYFVLGDNRNNSSDSHVWGLVPTDDIIGQAWLSYWPVATWGFVPSAADAYNAR